MNIGSLVWLVSLILPVRLVLAAEIDPCPIERNIAFIGAIDGPPGHAFVLRGAHRLPARPAQCLLYGDIVAADRTVIVDIVTPDSNRRIGRLLSATRWQAPPQPAEPVPAWLQLVQQAFDMFRRNWTTHDSGRGQTASCQGAPQEIGPPIGPLHRLPPRPQSVGADLTTLVVAWKRGSGFGDVTVRLGHTNGTSIMTKQVCRRAHQVLTLNDGVLRPGDALVLEARDVRGERLEWKINVVAPEQLPHPPGKVPIPWLLGAWRLVEADAEFWLDAVSRLESGTAQSVAAQQFREAVLADRRF